MTANRENAVQEDGPIKEHLLGQAWQKRQLTRDGKAFNANDFDFNLGNEDAPEEEAQYDHLDGEEVSAFNMKDEEAEGFNTLTGEIAPRKSEDDEVAKDPWLLSLQQEEVIMFFPNMTGISGISPFAQLQLSLSHE